MKQSLTSFLCLGLLALGGSAFAQSVTGPSSTKTPYLVPVANGAKITSIITVGDTAANGYKMVGVPDGLGAFDNGDGTFTVVMNHELGNTVGINRAHGSKGAFVSRWVINKSDLSVVSGADLMQNVYLWNNTNQNYDVYNAANPSTLAAFSRFCSADLAPVSAFYNSATGLGTQERIFMNGEENGTDGRAMGHVITGADAGNSYELPRLGRAGWENSVANGFTGDKTVVAEMDDNTPGQVYFYIGTKTNTGNTIEKAGLTNGSLYGVAVSGMLLETNASYAAPNTPFSLVSLGNVTGQSGSTLNTNTNAAGITSFLRPEDGAWDPSHPEDFYFATTNAFNSPSRLWKLHFTDINDLTLGGTITAVLDGTEGQQMLDNISIDHHGNIALVEDVGNNAHLGKTWNYNIATDAFTQLFGHDTTRFLAGGSQFLTQDEEASGILDVQDILGTGWFLCDDQAHYTIPGELAEGGQFFALFNPFTECSSLEKTVAVSGPTTICSAGSVTLTAGNGSSYLWSNGAVTKSITVNQGGNYSVKVSGASGCFVESDTVSVNVQAIPAVKIVAAPGSSLSICQGASTTLMADPATDLTGYDLQWNVDGNLIPGATDNSYTTTTGGAYTLTATLSAGCSRTSAAKTVTVKPNPVASFSAGGATTFCQGGSVVLNADVAAGVNYNWLKDGAGSGSGISKTVKISGDYAVVATLAGCKDTSAAQTVTVNAAPVASISSTDPSSLCSGEQAVLNASPSGAGYSYQWTLKSSNISGATNASYTASFMGTYKVNVTDNATGCSRLSTGYQIATGTTPNAAISVLGFPTIPSGGNVTLRATAGNGFTYQWNLNSNPIGGANSRDYVATQGGDYTVTITKGFCTNTSPAVTITQTGSKEAQGTTSVTAAQAEFGFSAYPNPTADVINVVVKGIENVNATIHVMDLNGRIIASRTMNGPAVTIDMAGYPSAVYLVRYKDDAGRTGTVRITKQ